MKKLAKTSVLIIIDKINDPRNKGGAHYVNFELVKVHVGMGFSVDVLFMGDHSAEITRFLGEFGVRMVYFMRPLPRFSPQKKWMGNVVLMPRKWAFPKELVMRKGKFSYGISSVLSSDDVIHVLRGLKHFSVITKSIIWEHRSIYHKEGAIRGPRKFLMRQGLRNADHVLAVSNPLAARITDFIGLDSKSCEVMGNPINSLVFRDDPVPDESGFLITREEFVFSVQNWARSIKGVDTLLEACSINRKRGSRLIFVLAGRRPENVKERLEALKLEDAVHFVGPVTPEKTCTFLKKCRLYVNASHVETFSISTAESLFVGKPVVVTRSGGPEDFVRPGVDGEVVRANDPESLARAIGVVDAKIEAFDTNKIKSNAVAQFSARAWCEKWKSFYAINCDQFI